MDKTNQEILGSVQEFEGFFKSHYALFCQFAQSFTNDPDDAEDAVQQCFVKLWEERKHLLIKGSLKPYLYRMIRNHCLNTIKHISVRESYKEHNQRELDSLSDDLTTDENQSLATKINAAIEKMPTQRKKVFELSRLHGLKYKEIAEELNISVKTVENHMGSALKFLRMELKGLTYLLVVTNFIEGIGDNWFLIVLLMKG